MGQCALSSHWNFLISYLAYFHGEGDEEIEVILIWIDAGFTIKKLNWEVQLQFLCIVRTEIAQRCQVDQYEDHEHEDPNDFKWGLMQFEWVADEREENQAAEEVTAVDHKAPGKEHN